MGEATPRAVLLGMLRRERGLDADAIARLADGSRFAPPPLSEAETVGWYAGGAAPGEEGAAVLVGHVDTESERAVFYELSTVEPGTTVEVTRTDGTVAAFTVEDFGAPGRFIRLSQRSGAKHGPNGDSTSNAAIAVLPRR